MINGENAILKNCIVHKINTKPENPDLEDEYGVVPSKSLLSADEESQKNLLQFFFSGFKAKEIYNLYNEGEDENVVFQSVTNIFDTPESFYDESLKIAEHLYQQGDSQRIKEGKLFVTHIDNCVLDGQTLEAVGLFKIETTSRFMKLNFDGENYGITYDEGVSLDKIDKACLIFNTERENGFCVAINDGIGRSAGAHYWIDQFLNARQRKDEYYQTQSVISLCKKFVTKELPKNEEFVVTRADQATILNESKKFFEENKTFDMDTFAEAVMPNEQIASEFKSFKEHKSEEEDLCIEDNFAISEPAVKKQSSMFRSVIKLDKNFHVYVHGNSKFIEKGYDEATDLQFYRLFFREEE